jgi:predicted transcriptional regulator
MRKDLLTIIRNHLESDVGQLRRVAEETGIPYDTILRIKNGEGDPGYSKVQALTLYYAQKIELGAGETAPAPERQAA